MNLLQKIDEAKKQIDTYRPLEGHMLKELKEYYRIGLTYTSNALEGNTLTESETKVVLEEGITIAGKPLKDHLEALGHSQAYDFIFQCMHGHSFSEEEIKRLHYLFYHKMSEQEAGVYRTKQVFISGSQYPVPTPDKIEQLMSDFIARQTELKQKYHPVEYAALVHKEFVFIHPFIDGNGRVARLLMNLVLLQQGYTIVVIPPVVRAQYIQALERAHVDDRPFIDFIAQRVYETQKDYLRLLGAEQAS